jgi:hypothetical protein
VHQSYCTTGMIATYNGGLRRSNDRDRLTAQVVSVFQPALNHR